MAELPLGRPLLRGQHGRVGLVWRLLVLLVDLLDNRRHDFVAVLACGIFSIRERHVNERVSRPVLL